MITVANVNPTQLYTELWRTIMKTGDEVKPRGKLIKELRPVGVEFLNPLNRVTFVPGRRINPFFQIAESFWILSGGADVLWPKLFNSSIGQFSDDGEWFNAPYGERLRYWNKNALHDIIINPIDQLADVLEKFKADKDTRQAVAVLYNPMFDNSNYTVGEGGKDICCNLVLTFKIRHDKLNLTVFNRSNDLHWGLFGANLCQFTTILEQMTAWLKQWYPEVEIGTYTQLTDSLHIYTEDYGAKSIATMPPERYYTFQFDDEPRITMLFDEFTEVTEIFATEMYQLYESVADAKNDIPSTDKVLTYLDQVFNTDNYWNFAFKALYAYLLIKRGELKAGLYIMSLLPECQWKVSMMYFLKHFIIKAFRESADIHENQITKLYESQVRDLADKLTNNTQADLIGYLKLH